LAEGLAADGELHTVDCNLELEDRVRGYFNESDWAKQIFYHLAKAEEFLSGWSKPIDLVFIDADKKNNALYYDLIFDFVKPGGIILIDNVLWSGKVLQEDKLDKDTSGIVALNEKIAADTRVEPLLLPIRDGLWVIRKK
jgi:predicted O-methyltransferase YrrM